MIRLPKRLVDRRRLDGFLGKAECAAIHAAGENLILDIVRDELEFEDWDDGSDWLAALAPLRAEVLAGDLRLFYLLWLMAVEADLVEAGEAEPLPGIGPMTAALEAFAEFFDLDPDLVEAAAERSAIAVPSAASAGAVLRIIAAMPDREKNRMLARLVDGEPHLAAELRAEIRDRLATEIDAPAVVARTVGELRSRARAIALAREQAAAEKAAAEMKRHAREAEKARRSRLNELVRRGERVWHEVESEIERRNPAGYDKAASLLGDLRALADERGTTPDFRTHLRAIRERHAGKGRFLERLTKIG
jgi:rubrerythrin